MIADLTLLMIEHDMDVALGLADRVTVLHRGRVILEGAPSEVQTNPEVRPGAALSGGEQQMLAVGRALMANPDLILMDEPSEGLAPRLVQQIESIMKRVRDHGHAVLLVEQNLALAMAVADHVHVVSSGHFVFGGAPRELAVATAVLEQHLGVAGKVGA